MKAGAATATLGNCEEKVMRISETPALSLAALRSLPTCGTADCQTSLVR